MEELQRVISRLESLQAGTHTVGNSAAGITFEISQFMRVLPDLIDQLKQAQIDLDMKNDHGCNHDH